MLIIIAIESAMSAPASAAPLGKVQAGEAASLPQLRYAAVLFFCCAALKISWTSPAGGSTQLTPSTQGVHQSQHSYHCQGTHTATQARLPNPLTAKHLQVQADTSLPDLCIRYQAAPRRQGTAQAHRQCSWLCINLMLISPGGRMKGCPLPLNNKLSQVKVPGRSSPCCIFSTRPVASGRLSRPRTLRSPVPKQTPHTRTPRPKQFGHSTNSYVSLLLRTHMKTLNTSSLTLCTNPYTGY